MLIQYYRIASLIRTMRLSVHLGRWWLYLADHRLRARQRREEAEKSGIIVGGGKFKPTLIAQRGCRCERCGKVLQADKLTVHHIFQPYYYPQYNAELWNLKLYCRPCHNYLHTHPEEWVAERRAVAKAHHLKI